ncbi:transposase [Tessaracoccus flavus]|uniref:transposase n=1 Tax=Tessaracoccus flavus TaxID=1610493 RepID=UPI000896978E|nr:transposase [Tessaracoccus flavus]SDY33628.1 Transposase IS116/IS110/IS902 family protein [Tessaracoccus flavus]
MDRRSWRLPRRQLNRLSACLRQYYPAALPLLDDKFDRRDVWAVLAKAPDPGSGRKLTHAQTVTTLKRAGRKRYLDHTAAKILDVLHSDQLAAPPQQSRALAVRTVTLIRILQATRAEIESVEAEMAAAFEQHPDAEIYLSLPGKGHVIGARVLGEFGDDPDRYEDVKARRNYAGTSPLTIASGRQRIVKARHVRPPRLADAMDRWAFSSLSRSPGALDYYHAKTAAGYKHHEALRALANRLTGILHGCLKTRTLYDENTAWQHRYQPAA